jgi:hypothetical protein
LVLFAFTFFCHKRLKTIPGYFSARSFSQGNLFGTAEILLSVGIKTETTVESPMVMVLVAEFWW